MFKTIHIAWIQITTFSDKTVVFALFYTVYNQEKKLGH